MKDILCASADLQVDNITYAGQTDSFSYDLDGLLTGAGSYTIARNAPNGLPESVTDGTVTQGRDFSGYGEVDGVEYSVGASSVYAWSVVRDNAGRITQKTEIIGLDTVTWDYTYDPMGPGGGVCSRISTFSEFEDDLRNMAWVKVQVFADLTLRVSQVDIEIRELTRDQTSGHRLSPVGRLAFNVGLSFTL